MTTLRARSLLLTLVAAAAAVAVVPAARAVESTPAPACGTTAAPLVIERTYSSSQARTYDYAEVEVPAGTQRIEVGYRWVDHASEKGLPANPVTQTVFDLGLWEGTTASDAGLRGWSGSRGGRLPARVWVADTTADRGYRPGPITPGSWFVEIGVAAVGPDGATVHVEVACRTSDPAAGSARPKAGPVPEHHVAGTCAEPSGCWYHADFHLHGYHSATNGPEWEGPDGVIDQATAAGLDVVPVTDYVTSAHWDELGAVQAAHPDVLLWPGREIITYFGHSIVLGVGGVGSAGRPDLDHDLDHRHGYGGLSLRDIQDDVVASGASFSVAHPTIFPGPAFRNFCRGCEFELGDVIDWSKVTSMEVVTGPVLADLSDVGGPGTHSAGLSAQQPFVATAVQLWEDRLAAGFKIAPVSGSDYKGGPDSASERARKGYGSSATAILAPERSIPALRAALEAGHAYVRTRGVHASPALDLAVEPLGGGPTYTFGDEIQAAAATMHLRVREAAGQTVRLSRNGVLVAVIPIVGDDVTLDLPIVRNVAEERTPAASGRALGTFWRVDVADARSLTAIGNAVFLQG